MLNRGLATRVDARRTRRMFARAFGVLLVLGGGLVVTIPPAGAKSTISGDQARIAQIESKLDADENSVQSIVAQYNVVSSKLATIDAKIATDQKQLQKDRRSTARAQGYLRQVAIAAYVNAQFGGTGGAAAYAGTSTATAVLEKNVYLATVNGTLESATARLENDELDVSATEQALAVVQSETAATLRQVESSKQAAVSAIASEDSLLSGLKGNLLTLVTEAAAKRAEEREAAAEEAIAEEAAARAAETPPAPTTVAAAPTSGSYENPLRSLSGLSPERIDQGVDYEAFGPIYAIGDGDVISTVNGGWPGGTFITYRLTDGPAAGLTVYSAEDIDPKVFVGEHVTASTVIGDVYEGGTGIEVGWADPSGDGETMAADNYEYYGWNSTAFGLNFSRLLESLGAPGGQLQGSVAGSVPISWPNW